MAEQKGQTYMQGAAILTAGVIIMKILGFIYKVPLANILGDDGYSLFLSSYNVYNVFFTLATAGFPVALARMISTANATDRPNQVHRTFVVAERTFLVIGITFALVMALFPNLLASTILHNPEAALSIRAMAPSVLIVCLLSAHRGFCEGYGDMIPTTVGQVIEVLVKVVVGLSLAGLMFAMNMGKSWASAGAISGATVGSLVALGYMAFIKRKKYPYVPGAGKDVPEKDSVILKKFISIGIPMAIGSCIMALLNLVDSGLCMGRLQGAAGFSYENAQVLYGVYGEAQTIFNLPAAIITPIAIAIVPAISAAVARGADDEATKITEDSLRICALLAMPMGAGLAVMSYPIMRVIYPNSHEAGPALLLMLGIAAFFVCMVLVENAALQAAGHEKLPMISMIAGSLVKIIVNWFLIGNAEVHIYGAPIGTLCGYIVMAAMNFIFMCRVLDKNPRLGVIAGGPLVCSAAMSAAAFGVYKLLGLVLPAGRMFMLLSMAAAILAAVAVYLLMVIKTRAITAEDMRLIPKGEKLAAILHIK